MPQEKAASARSSLNRTTRRKAFSVPCSTCMHRSCQTVTSITTKLSQESLFQSQSDAIRKAASEHSCVFVGRCADYVLRDFDNTVSVFITADLDERISRVCERHNCTEDEAKKIIESKESTRSSYYNYYTGKEWGHSSSYDLCINSSILGMQGTAEFIKEFINKKLKAGL